MNVLGKVVVPKCKATCWYIIDALEELARDEFYRRKMILEVKAKEGHRDGEGSKCNEDECSLICDDDKKKPTLTVMNDHVVEILDLVNSIDDKKFSESDIKEFLNLGEELKSKLYESVKPETHLSQSDFEDNAKTDIDIIARENNADVTNTQIALPPAVEKEITLGPVEIEIKEITKIVRSRNEDGTYREVKKTIKIKKEIKNTVIENVGSNISDISTDSNNFGNDKMTYEPSTSSSKSTPSHEARIQMIKVKDYNIRTQQLKGQSSERKLRTVLCDNLLKNDLPEASMDFDIEYLKSKYFYTNCRICKGIPSKVFKVQDFEELEEKYELAEKIL